MSVPIARGPRYRGHRIGVALGALLALAACADPPTDTTAGSIFAPRSPDLQPTVSPLVTAECPAGTSTASGALPGRGALYSSASRPPGTGASSSTPTAS